MGRCGAPCDGSETVEAYAEHAAAVAGGDARRRTRGRGRRDPQGAPGWPTPERYEDAALHRDRLAAFVRAAARLQRLSALTGCAELVGRPAARRPAAGSSSWSGTAGWRAPRSPARARGPAGRSRDALVATAEVVSPGARPDTGLPRPRRPSACCAGSSSRAPGWSRSPAPGPAPTYGAGGVRLWAEAARQRPRPARPVRRPPRHPAGAPAGRRGQPDRLRAAGHRCGSVAACPTESPRPEPRARAQASLTTSPARTAVDWWRGSRNRWLDRTCPPGDPRPGFSGRKTQSDTAARSSRMVVPAGHRPPLD